MSFRTYLHLQKAITTIPLKFIYLETFSSISSVICLCQIFCFKSSQESASLRDTTDFQYLPKKLKCRKMPKTTNHLWNFLPMIINLQVCIRILILEWYIGCSIKKIRMISLLAYAVYLIIKYVKLLYRNQILTCFTNNFFKIRERWT